MHHVVRLHMACRCRTVAKSESLVLHACDRIGVLGSQNNLTCGCSMVNVWSTLFGSRGRSPPVFGTCCLQVLLRAAVAGLASMLQPDLAAVVTLKLATCTIVGLVRVLQVRCKSELARHAKYRRCHNTCGNIYRPWKLLHVPRLACMHGSVLLHVRGLG